MNFRRWSLSRTWFFLVGSSLQDSLHGMVEVSVRLGPPLDCSFRRPAKPGRPILRMCRTTYQGTISLRAILRSKIRTAAQRVGDEAYRWLLEEGRLPTVLRPAGLGYSFMRARDERIEGSIVQHLQPAPLPKCIRSSSAASSEQISSAILALCVSGPGIAMFRSRASEDTSMLRMAHSYREFVGYDSTTTDSAAREGFPTISLQGLSADENAVQAVASQLPLSGVGQTP